MIDGAHCYFCGCENCGVEVLFLYSLCSFVFCCGWCYAHVVMGAYSEW